MLVTKLKSIVRRLGYSLLCLLALTSSCYAPNGGVEKDSGELRKVIKDFCEYPMLFWENGPDRIVILVPDMMELSFNQVKEAADELISRKDESFYGDVAAMIVRYYRVDREFRPKAFTMVDTRKGILNIFANKYKNSWHYPDFRGDEIFLADLGKWIIKNRKNLPPSELLNDEIEQTEQSNFIYKKVALENADKD